MFPVNQDDPELIAEVRANIAFEQMVVAALISAAVTAASLFSIEIVEMIGGVASIGGVGMALYHSISFSAIFFLIAFAAAAVVGAPLFKAMEKSRIRKIWPYAAASLAVGFIVAAALGRAPTFDAISNFLLLAPGLLMSLIFGRLIKPHWKASETSARSTNITRLH